MPTMSMSAGVKRTSLIRPLMSANDPLEDFERSELLIKFIGTLVRPQEGKPCRPSPVAPDRAVAMRSSPGRRRSATTAKDTLGAYAPPEQGSLWLARTHVSSDFKMPSQRPGAPAHRSSPTGNDGQFQGVREPLQPTHEPPATGQAKCR